MIPLARRRFAVPEGARNAFTDLAVVRNGGRVGWLQTLGGEPTPAASEAFPPAVGEVTVH
jgi:hypothetical protein